LAQTSFKTGAFKDIDKGWQEIKKSFRDLDGSFVKVGIQEGEKYIDPDDGTTSDLVLIAAANEFGTSTIPSRPFMRQAFDMNRNEIHRLQKKVLSGVMENKISPKKGLEIIGQFMEAKIKQRIVDLRSPPNAESTQRAKARRVGRRGVRFVNNPLIDTGQMRQSVRAVVFI